MIMWSLASWTVKIKHRVVLQMKMEAVLMLTRRLEYVSCVLENMHSNQPERDRKLGRQKNQHPCLIKK